MPDTALACLDFANTSCGAERLGSYAELLAWCRNAGLIDDTTEDRLRGEAVADMSRARRELGRGWMVRQSLRDVFAGISADGSVPETAATRLNLAFAGSPMAFVIGQRAGSITLDHVLPPDDVLAPVLLSAARLLGSDERARLRCCEAAGCGRFYLDTTRNRSRRWCDMATCGNRAKARRHRERVRPGRRSGA